MTPINNNIDWKFISGLILIILASLISWTLFFVFITIILYPVGAILVFVSRKKLWVKLVTTTIPLFFTFPTALLVIKLLEYLES